MVMRAIMHDAPAVDRGRTCGERRRMRRAGPATPKQALLAACGRCKAPLFGSVAPPQAGAPTVATCGLLVCNTTVTAQAEAGDVESVTSTRGMPKVQRYSLLLWHSP